MINSSDRSKKQGLQNIDEWIEKLNKQEMPIFAETVRKINIVVGKENSNISELARVILQDALVTSQILKAANSAYYSAGRRRDSRSDARDNINTVTQAVLVLGFDFVQSICQAKIVIEALLRGNQRQRLITEMASSFHAAVQAQSVAAHRKDKSPEEVFIATLLYHLGNMVFSSFAEETLVKKLEAAMQEPVCTQEKAEMEILGFRLQDLTARLSKEWHLGNLLQDVLEDRGSSNPRVENIMLGHKLAQSVNQGWENANTQELIGQFAKYLNVPIENAMHILHENAKEAIQIAVNYGANAASRFIPLPAEYSSESSAGIESDSGKDNEKQKFLPPDPMLQLKILQELSNYLIKSDPDYNLFLSIALEGIYRSIGMDRILFALLSKNEENLESRFILGWTDSHKVQDLVFNILCSQTNIFTHVIELRQAIWMKSDAGVEISKLLTPEILNLTGHSCFFVAPVVVQRQTIGLIFADRYPSGRLLDEDSFISFQHFTQQINMGLSFIIQKKS